jgi:hypothetical protein
MIALVLIIIVLSTYVFGPAITIAFILGVMIVLNYDSEHFTFGGRPVVGTFKHPEMAETQLGINQAAAVDDARGISRDEQSVDIYGPFYEMYHQYNNVHYAQPPSRILNTCSERSNQIDAKVAQYSQSRARDKRCTDGWVTKNADYYKYHYANELSDTENKPWWGREEW